MKLEYKTEADYQLDALMWALRLKGIIRKRKLQSLWIFVGFTVLMSFVIPYEPVHERVIFLSLVGAVIAGLTAWTAESLMRDQLKKSLLNNLDFTDLRAEYETRKEFLAYRVKGTTIQWEWRNVERAELVDGKVAIFGVGNEPLALIPSQAFSSKEHAAEWIAHLNECLARAARGDAEASADSTPPSVTQSVE